MCIRASYTGCYLIGNFEIVWSLFCSLVQYHYNSLCTSFLMVCRYDRRSPCFTNSVMRQSGSWMVTQPTRPTTWGLFPLAIFFMVSISWRKSVLSLPVALAGMNGVCMHVMCVGVGVCQECRVHVEEDDRRKNKFVF